MQTLTAKPSTEGPDRPATLVDVAREAGVSVATVSRVLNSKLSIPITPETEQRIRDAAERLAYRPNAIARALATRRTFTVVLFTQELTDPHFAQMLPAVEDELRRRGYHLAVCTEIEGLLTEGRVDGAILLANPGVEQHGVHRLPIPAVYVWSARVPLPNCITWDDVAGAALAVGHLAELGHRAIVGLFGDYADGAETPDKVAGYRAAVGAVPGSAGPIEWRGRLSGDQFENGVLLTKKALETGRDWTAIFARNDFLALGALRALRHAGIRVPDDVSIVGYNDTVIARIADPPMTSVLTPIAEAGALAAQTLVNAVERRSNAVAGVTLPVRLTERKSCAPPRS